MDQEDIRAGSEWDMAIEKALETCDYLLFIQSEKSVTSTNVLNEVYYALDENKRVIPIIISDSKTPFRISRLQHINFIADYESGLASLLSQLKSGAFPELQPSKDDETLEKIMNPFIKKHVPFKLVAASLIIFVAVTVVYFWNTKKQTDMPIDTVLNLNETFIGEWKLAAVVPTAASYSGYLKIEATNDEKMKITSNFQFYYFKTNDTAFFNVFNGYAGCASCVLQN
ncbi:MAG: toll/interleukin-1 receptor domain-containing protein, partial [Panacibacter sp.]